MKHLVLPALLTAALLTPPAAHAGETAPEDVDTVVTKDARSDVVADGEDGGRPSPAARSTTDIVRVTHEVDRTAQVLTTTVKVRDLTGAGQQAFAVMIEDERADARAFVSGTRGRRQLHASTGDGPPSRCRDGKVVTRWAKNEVVLRVPFACVGSVESARLTTVTFTFTRAAFLSDETRRTRAVSFTAPAS